MSKTQFNSEVVRTKFTKGISESARGGEGGHTLPTIDGIYIRQFDNTFQIVGVNTLTLYVLQEFILYSPILCPQLSTVCARPCLLF